MSAANDIKRGKDAILYFHNQALKYPENYNLSLQGLTDKITADSPNFFANLGGIINIGNVPDETVQQTMEAIANQGQGRLPAHYADITDAVIKGVPPMTFQDALVGGVEDSIKQMSAVVSDAGKTAIGAVTTGITLLPFALVGALFLFIYLEAKH